MKKNELNKAHSQIGEIWHRFRRNKTAMAGLIVFLIFILVAICAQLIVPYHVALDQHGDARTLAPSLSHLFGTDQYGRDIFARVIHGARYSLSIGVVTSFFTLVIGGALGSIAAYYGGIVDSVIMRIVDVFMCIPFMLLALAIVSALGSSLSNLLIAITISNLPTTIRLVRSCILNVVDEDYIEAARSYGTADGRIIFRHIFPNAMGPIIVNTTMGMANMILAAAGLSFMGLGIQPPTPEWGSMLSNARDYMMTAPHMLYIPGIAILIAVLSINLIGDGLRDALDPKLKD